jgi:hypothetical protein
MALSLLGAAAAALVLTGSSCRPPDRSPVIFDLEGPSSGRVSETLGYSVHVLDHDGDSVSVLFHWDDGTPWSWSEFHSSQHEFVVLHVFTIAGHYSVTAKAQDRNGNESGWMVPIEAEILPARR